MHLDEALKKFNFAVTPNVYQRPKVAYNNGLMETVFVAIGACSCGDQRGPWGGVCGECGNAILTEEEQGPK